METIIFILMLVGLYIGIALIVAFFKAVGQKIRDKAAREVFSRTDFDYEKEKKELNLTMFELGFKEELYCEQNGGFFKFVRTYKKRHSSKAELTINFSRCPECRKGYLEKRSGRFGKFIGCSNYPRCSYTDNIKNFKKTKSEEFISKMRKAYF